MDYKEKYEKALKSIQEILSSGVDSIKMSELQSTLQGIFPELRIESKDEKIRKNLNNDQFEDLLKKWNLDPNKATQNKDGSIDYNGDVNLSGNDFTKLPINFNKVTGYFDLSSCKELLSLDGCPKKVGSSFYCFYCIKLTSLKGCPEEVGESFICSNCESLTSLEGCPVKVGGNFNCSDCLSLTSLEGCPYIVKGVFNCCYCGKEFKTEEVKKYCNVKGRIIL